VIWQNESSVPYGEKHGLDRNMAEVDAGAPDGATDLVREFY
jgi:2-oxoglutarate ferredoxin oxidoreductase subunit beta